MSMIHPSLSRSRDFATVVSRAAIRCFPVRGTRGRRGSPIGALFARKLREIRV